MTQKIKPLEIYNFRKTKPHWRAHSMYEDPFKNCCTKKPSTLLDNGRKTHYQMIDQAKKPNNHTHLQQQIGTLRVAVIGPGYFFGDEDVVLN